MTTKLLNLQDSFLNQIRKENIPVIIYLWRMDSNYAAPSEDLTTLP